MNLLFCIIVFMKSRAPNIALLFLQMIALRQRPTHLNSILSSNLQSIVSIERNLFWYLPTPQQVKQS